MPRIKKLTDYIYSPTNPASEDDIRGQIDGSIQEVYDDSARANATVNLTGDQTIAGIKTFSSSPIVPAPTTDLQVSTKKYVDDRELAIEADFNAKDAQNVKLTGNQTITDVKTFSSSPIVPTPTGSTQSANKGYVDTVLADAVLGTLPDNSIQNIKLAPDVKIGSLATLTTTDKSSVTNAINEINTNTSNIGYVKNNVGAYFQASLIGDLILNQSASSVTTANDIVEDDLYVYAGNSTTVRKYLKSNMTFVSETPSYGGIIYAVSQDDTHIYAGGATTQKVRKYLKSDMSFVSETPSYGGNILTIAVDSTHVYAGGATTNTVRKYLKSDMSFVAQTPSYGGSIQSVADDSTHIYAGGATTNTVRKYLKSDMTLSAESPSYGGTINSVALDSVHIYAGGATTNAPRKYLKSDMTLTLSFDGFGFGINKLKQDEKFIHACGGSVVKTYRKTSATVLKTSPTFSATIAALATDGTFVYCNNATNTITKLNVGFSIDELFYIGG